ncbi:MAG: DUF3291 domain-containing protein [Paracoccus sp. (in: a-proteobacteria)]
MPLALYTFGMFAKPSENPANEGFHQLNDLVFESVDQAEGLIARSGYASDAGPSPWGDEVYPRFYEERGDGWSPATLSLWTDLEAPFSFTYSGLHAIALGRGREWFEKPRWPPLVLWWHTDSDYPSWAEGVRRHELLHDCGPSPAAFSFKEPFDEKGVATSLDKARIRKMRQASEPS